jgi:spore germination cell wall hydrolase CwlJ-like protein
MIIEGMERVSSPYDYNKEYLIYINPHKSKLRHLVKNRLAVRGLVLSDRKTVVFVDAKEADHDMIKQNLVDDLGFDLRHVEESYELFLTQIKSKEGSYYNKSLIVGDMKVYYRSVELGGMDIVDLFAMNFGLRNALSNLSEKDIKDYVNALMEQELMEGSISQRITSIIASLGLTVSTVVAPMKAVTHSTSAEAAVNAVEAVDAPIVIDEETFERWMTEPSHDEVEHKSMENIDADYYDLNELVRTDDFIYLALTMWGEARSQGELGMRAIGHVIVNRATVGANMWGGDTIPGVALHDRQFSCWNQNDPNRERMLNIDQVNPATPDGQAWKLAQVIAIQILTGHSDDPTGGATMYHSTSVNPYWAASERNQETTRVAGHIFYVDTRWL